MSCQPEPVPDPRRRNPRLVDQLHREARNRRRVRDSEQRIQQARAAGADDFIYTWHTTDDREAEMLVYFLPGEEIEVVACQLLRLDGSQATAGQQADYADEFDAEMAAGGDLWMQVVSHVWERAS